MTTSLWLGSGVIVVALLGRAADGAADVHQPRPPADVKATIVAIADRWVASWLDKDWDAPKGIFTWRHGPYSDAFEHHYVAAVLVDRPESRFHRHDVLAKRVISDLLYHSGVFVEQCGGKGLRGYWALNGAADKGVPVGSGSWQSRSFIRACLLLDKQMTPEQRTRWREGAKQLIAALTVDGRETYGPWWSTNKVADHVAGVAQWLQVSRDPKAKEFLDRQFDWYWRAFPQEGFADKYHNYFAKTMFRLAPALLVPQAQRYHEPLLRRIRMWRSFIAPNGFYDAALHDEPNCDEAWHSKLGPVVSLLLLAAPADPELAFVAQHIVAQRLADWDTEGFWATAPNKFDAYFGGHWGSLGLILESAPQWQKAMASAEPEVPRRFSDMRFFDYWRGLGRFAVLTRYYQASGYLHWAWTWDFAPLGGMLHHVNTPGTFRFIDAERVGGRVVRTPRTETGRAWLDWDPHADPQTGQERTALVVARSGERLDSLPPSFPEEAVVTALKLPGGRLYGLTHCRYRLGEALEVRTSNVFLNDAIVVLNTITALKDASFDALYVQQSLANPGDLVAVTPDGRTIEFVPDNVKPKASVSYPVGGPFDLRSRDGTGALGLAPLANSFTKQELVDIALSSSPYGDRKRAAHRVEAWRGHLPAAVKTGDVLLADFAYVPHDARAGFKPAFQILRTPGAHGVIVPGEPSVAIGQSVRAGGRAELAIGDLRFAGELLAAELSGQGAAKVSFYGRSVAWKGKPLIQLSREAAATILLQRGEGIVDAGLGPIEVTCGRKAWRLFSTNHEFPRRACLALRLGAKPEEPPAAGVADVEGACRRFASLPERIEAAARLAEIDMLQRSAVARGMKPTATSARLAEARKEVLALHEAADLAGKPVVAVMDKGAPAALLPPVVAAQDRYPANYLVSFAEEQGREAIERRAEALCHAAAGRPDADKLCAQIRHAEAILLGRYFGLPICWTREHIPGQPDFFWRPILVGEGKGQTAPATAWEKAIAQYLVPGDRLWLALGRLEAAAKLVAE